MLNLQCKVEIRSKSTNKLFTFDYANSIEVKTSCENLCDSREFLDLIKLFLVKSEKLKIKSFVLLDAIGLDSITLQN